MASFESEVDQDFVVLDTDDEGNPQRALFIGKFRVASYTAWIEVNNTQVGLSDNGENEEERITVDVGIPGMISDIHVPLRLLRQLVQNRVSSEDIVKALRALIPKETPVAIA